MEAVRLGLCSAHAGVEAASRGSRLQLSLGGAHSARAPRHNGQHGQHGQHGQKGQRGPCAAAAVKAGSQRSRARASWRPAGAAAGKPRATVWRARAAAAPAPRADVAVEKGSVSVVLLSGGVGKRMGASMPKQYLPLSGQPIALYSLLTFAAMEEVGEIVIVCDPGYRDIFQGAIALDDTQKADDKSTQKVDTQKVAVKFALPGKERQDSVFNGLQMISPSASLVAVHDSARPLVSELETRRVLSDAAAHGAAVLGVPSKATIKEANESGFVARTLDRRLLWEMQTPQVIRPQLLRDGFDLVREKGLEVTDDVSIVEHLGHPVKITEGLYTNIKVTTPDDLLIAEKLLAEAREAASVVRAVAA